MISKNWGNMVVLGRMYRWMWSSFWGAKPRGRVLLRNDDCIHRYIWPRTTVFTLLASENPSFKNHVLEKNRGSLMVKLKFTIKDPTKKAIRIMYWKKGGSLIVKLKFTTKDPPKTPMHDFFCYIILSFIKSSSFLVIFKRIWVCMKE